MNCVACGKKIIRAGWGKYYHIGHRFDDNDGVSGHALEEYCNDGRNSAIPFRKEVI